MKTSLLTLLCILFFGQAFSQTLEGRLLNADGQALAFATIEVLKSDSSVFKFETTNEQGVFRVSLLKAEEYILVFNSLGYNSLIKRVEMKNAPLNLGEIALEANSTELGEVVVAAEKALIQVDPDKTIFNVAKGLNNSGDNGIEVLRKAPGLQVDNEDNIIVEGKSGVLIYVNGKQSFLSGQDLTNYLKSLNADEIESIEIITQPSSKYDAAGSAGILNIVLKREKGLGLKGNISNTFTYGKYGRNNTSATLNYRQKKFALTGSYSHFQGSSYYFFKMYREQVDNIFDGETYTRHENMNDNLNLSGDIYLSEKSTLSAAVSIGLNNSTSEAESVTEMGDISDEKIDSLLLAPNVSRTDVENFTATLNYTYDNNQGRTFSVDVDAIDYTSFADSYQPNIYTDPNEEVILRQSINFQETPIHIQVLSSKADYEQKLWDGVLSLGVKGSQVFTENIFDWYDVVNDEYVFNSVRSNVFEYTETIGAGYVNYQFQKEKWKFQGGLRAEQTFSEGDLKSTTQVDNRVVKRQYLNWFPSGGATYQANRNHSFALIYSRRIERPTYRNLNPFISQINELSFRRGNPFLQPQYTHNIKISNTYKYTLNTSFTYSYVSDYFAEVTEAEGDRKSFINTRNVADQQTYNFSVSYPWRIKDWWNVYANAYCYYTIFTANHPDFIPIDRVTAGGYAQSTFNLGKQYRAEISGWFNSPSIWRGTFRTKSLGSLNLGLQRDWGSWTAKLSVNDVLYTNPWRAENRFGDLYLTGTGGNDSRNVRLYLSYNFGHNDVKEARKRRSSAEDEQNRLE